MPKKKIALTSKATTYLTVYFMYRGRTFARSVSATTVAPCGARQYFAMALLLETAKNFKQENTAANSYALTTSKIWTTCRGNTSTIFYQIRVGSIHRRSSPFILRHSSRRPLLISCGQGENRRVGQKNVTENAKFIKSTSQSLLFLRGIRDFGALKN